MPANAPRGSSTASRGSARRGGARLVIGLPLRASVGHGGCPDKRDGTTPRDDSRRLAPAPTAPGLRAFQRHFVPLLRRRLLGPSYGVVPAPHRPHETRRRGDRAPWRARCGRPCWTCRCPDKRDGTSPSPTTLFPHPVGRKDTPQGRPRALAGALWSPVLDMPAARASGTGQARPIRRCSPHLLGRRKQARPYGSSSSGGTRTTLSPKFPRIGLIMPCLTARSASSTSLETLSLSKIRYR